MWKLRGKGSWVVEDPDTKTKHLFHYKKFADKLAKDKELAKPYRRN